VTDYGSSMVHWMRNRKPRWKQKNSLIEAERPSASYIVDMLPPVARPTQAADTIPTKFLHSSLNKVKYPINVVLWTPEGRRLLTASSSGEFTLWNGMGFNFETIMQAHDVGVRAACYSHSEEWLISGDQDGLVKYWQPNFNNLKELQAHGDGIRGIAFAPTDAKFVTGSDDATLKVFDFAAGTDEVTLTGHQWEVRCLDWHPTKGLIVSGSKDHTVKLWDPRTGRCLTTLSSSKNQISRTVFEPSQGIMLATCGRDHLVRVFDIRMMRDVFILRGHENDVTSLTWHPIHRNLISTGGHGGAMIHYLLDEQNLPPNMEPSLSPYDNKDPKAPPQNIYPAHSIPYAHEPTGPIWSLAWHPLGHILASGSNDRITRFWTRARPGDTVCFNDRYHIGQAAAEAQGTYDRRGGLRQDREEEEQEAQDEAEGLVDQKMPSRAGATAFPGLPGLVQAAPSQNGSSAGGPQLPGIGGAPAPNPLSGLTPAPLPGIPPLDPSKFDLSKIAQLFGGSIPPIPPPGAATGAPFPPPIPGFPPTVPPPPNAFPGGLPPGFPPPGTVPGMSATPEQNGQSEAAMRRRAPLPSQQESLKEEMRRGKGRKAR